MFDVDYLLKNQNAEVHRMRFPGQNGYRLPASPGPVIASPSQEQRESRLRPFCTSRQPSSRKPKFSNLIWAVHMRREEVKARHGFAKGMATTSG